MGFFSKVFKGIGKVFKKIGKGIKSAFKKFGRFMGKIGILGQIAMMFILPGIGNAILGTAGTAATVAGIGGATVTAAAIPASGLLGGALGSIGVAAGKAAVWVGNKIATVKNVFSNITQGITETLGNFAKTAGKKLGFKGDMFTNAADNFFSSGTTGGDTAFSKSFGSSSKFQNLTTDFSKVSKAIDDIEIKDEIKIEGGNIEQGIKPQTGLEANASWDTPDFDYMEKIDKQMQETGGVGPEVYGTEGTIYETLPADRPSILAPETKTFGQKLAEAPRNLYEGVKGKTETFLEDPAGALFDDFGAKVTEGVQSQSLQALGLEDKPQAPIYNQYAAYVPSFDVAPQGTYGAPEIMSARDFEQQVTNNTSPYGYTAFQYQNYMAQFGQTA
tara:strand:+ start:221 stop:1384 length:1164 start_codon:yes stop_codon:yes gene_type:complete